MIGKEVVGILTLVMILIGATTAIVSGITGEPKEQAEAAPPPVLNRYGSSERFTNKKGTEFITIIADDCEYVYHHGCQMMAHKGNCRNPEHQED